MSKITNDGLTLSGTVDVKGLPRAKMSRVFCCLQTSTSEATFVALLAARTEAINRYRARDPTLEDAEINARLVAYCSDQARTLTY